MDQTVSPCSLVGFWAGFGWLVLVCCERKILLAGWFGLAETNKLPYHIAMSAQGVGWDLFKVG